MKILYIHQYFNTRDMPGSTRSFELAKRLVKSGHQVFMITSKRDMYQQKRKGWTLEEGIHVIWIPVLYSNDMGFLRRILSFILFSCYAVRVSLQLNVDTVFATSTPLTIAIPAIIYSKIKHRPMIFEVRDLWPEIPIAVGALKSALSIKLARVLEKFAYNNSKRVVALSEGMQKGIIKTGYSINRTSVITNLSDTDKFNSSTIDGKINISGYDWESSNPTVIYTGAFGNVNGVVYLVELAKAMLKLDNQVRFIIAGEGIEEGKIINKAKTLDLLNNNLFISKPIQKSEMPILYAKATIVTSLFIDLKELWNNSANKFFDGLAAGKPVMINYSGWQKKLLENNGAGFFIPPDNPLEGAKILKYKMTDTNKLRLMGKAARELAEGKFSIDVQYPKFEEVLKSTYHG